MHPVSVGETWRHIFANIVLKVTGTEATIPCHGDQLITWIEVGIDGAVHGIQDIWDKNLAMEDWVFLLV